MIKPYSREEILNLNKVFTHHLLDVQDAKHNPKNSEYVVGQEVILDDSNKSIVLTKELADKLNQNDWDHYQAKRDKRTSEIEVKFAGNITLISSKKTPFEYLTQVGVTINELRIHTNNQHLIILGDWPTPWLNQENDYEPVKESFKYLERFITHDFKGGFLLNGKELIVQTQLNLMNLMGGN